MWRALIYNLCGDWKTVGTCTMKYCLETLQDRKFYEVMSISALLPLRMVWTIKFQLHKLVHVGIFHEYWTGLLYWIFQYQQRHILTYLDW